MKNKIEYYGKHNYTNFDTKYMYICIKVLTYTKLDFYYCFGDTQLYIPKKKRHAKSVENFLPSGDIAQEYFANGLKNQQIKHNYRGIDFKYFKN